MPANRQLSAVLFTDIEGYTALVQEDEQQGLSIRNRHREVVQKGHDEFNGRIIQYYGDGTLSIFPSVIDAVNCAIAMQKTFRLSPVVPVRMGLHIGDIIFEDGQVFGNGVNLASRIESLGVAGSVLISDKVNDELKNHPNFKTVSMGVYELKNIQQKVEVFAIADEGLKVPVPKSLEGKTRKRKPTSFPTVKKFPFGSWSQSALNRVTRVSIQLKTKIWLTVLIIVLMFSFFSLYYYPAQQEKELVANYENEVQNLANTMSMAVKTALTEETFQNVKAAMGLLKDDPRLQFVKLRVMDTVRNEDHTYSLNESVYTFPEESNGSRTARTDKSVIKKTSRFDSKIMSGVIEVGLNTDIIERDKKSIRNTSLIASAAVLGIGILIGFWLSRSISVPVLALRDAANKVGEGDLTQRVINHSGDEIGELARAFNKMVEDLYKAREALNTANLDLTSTNETLHKTVADLEATQDQLIQAEKMASLGQLTAGIAHEINNPINFVSANIQPLKDDLGDVLKMVQAYEKIVREKIPERDSIEVRKLQQEMKMDVTLKEVNDLLKGMEEGAKRTAEIVKGLRNFSRLDQNVFLSANLNESLDSCLVLLNNSYKNRIQIVRQFGEIPEVDCLPGQINQVFMNVLSNAIQAIPAEGTITVRTWQVNDQVKISIRDTGLGMTDDVQKKIFDPFFTTKGIGKGTGLGMSISFGIIQKHNGKIELISKPGEGSEFIITVPINQ
jgi:signal transduction histidine kinase/class 3 adenylate cyclase